MYIFLFSYMHINMLPVQVYAQRFDYVYCGSYAIKIVLNFDVIRADRASLNCQAAKDVIYKLIHRPYSIRIIITILSLLCCLLYM